MILVVDNYDSFVHNLARYLRRLGQETHVVRNTAIDADAVRRMAPQAIVLSPGPCAPRQAGASLELVRQFHAQVPILGVCLGHQIVAEAFGASIVRARRPVHGQPSPVFHDGEGVFAGLPSPLQGGRYHSLIVDEASMPSCLRVSARTEDATVMAFRHASLPVVGLQFHPESILTEYGSRLLANFLRLAGIASSQPLPDVDA